MSDGKSIREIAEEIAERHHPSRTLTQNAELVSDIEQALRDERARCRKIAQSWEHRSDVNPARAIASAIQHGVEP